MSDAITIFSLAGAAAVASVAGGLIALWRKPTSLFMSVVLGFTSGVLLATLCFEMLPEALELSGLPLVVLGFLAGFAVIYAFDLYVHDGQVAGRESEQRQQVTRLYERHRLRASNMIVFAGGTSVEELIEGLSIGVGAVIKPGLGLLIALAIVIDNVSEGLSIGAMIRAEQKNQTQGVVRQIVGWTGLIGLTVFGSTLAGWFLLRGLSKPALGSLFAVAAGGLFYLTVTELVPQAEEYQYQQSSAIAMAGGFLLILVLSRFY